LKEDEVYEGDEVYEELAALVGPETAKRLFDHYSGSSVYYSKRISIRLRHRQIRDEFKKGASYRELGLKYGYGEKYVRTIIHGKEKKNG